MQATTPESARYTYQASGYFNKAEALIQALLRLRWARGVYLTLHPCQPTLMASAHNRQRGTARGVFSSSFLFARERRIGGSPTVIVPHTVQGSSPTRNSLLLI